MTKLNLSYDVLNTIRVEKNFLVDLDSQLPGFS